MEFKMDHDLRYSHSNLYSHSQLHSLETLESKFNMYERQIDQLFDFAYRDQDDIKTLFTMNDKLRNTLEVLEKKDDSPLLELNKCIINYYHLELENKRRLENAEWYQFQLFIVQLFIISYLIYIRF